MKSIKAVIFDMDGLILDTEKLLVKYWCLAANEAGFPMKREHALYIRSLSKELCEPYLKGVLGESFDYMSVRSRRKELMNEYILKNGIELKPGVKELLDFLKNNNIRTAVCTATDYPRTKMYLEIVGLLEKFDKIICGPDVVHGKPAPDIYLYACKSIGFDSNECIALEDSPNGVKSAYEAGLDVIMIPDLTEPSEDDRKYIKASAKNLTEVIKIIECILSKENIYV